MTLLRITKFYRHYAEENSKHINFKELKGSDNGTIFYDKDNNIVVIRVDGNQL